MPIRSSFTGYSIPRITFNCLRCRMPARYNSVGHYHAHCRTLVFIQSFEPIALAWSASKDSMSSEKSLAIVLRTVEFSETSLVVTLLTEGFGKVVALAKGARRLKGPFDGALDLLTICRVVFLRKSSGSLDLLTEAKLERRFHAATSSLPALNAGYYLAEMLRELTDEHDPHPQLFCLAHNTLVVLDELQPQQNQEVAQHVMRFELMALRLLGHLPSLSLCASCGAQVSAARRISFGMISGGVLCDRCRGGKRQVASISAEAIESMKVLAQENDLPGEFALSRPIAGEIRGLLNRYMCNLLGHQPKTQRLLN